MSIWDRFVRWFTDPGEACSGRTDVDRFGRNKGHYWNAAWGEVKCTLCGRHGYIEYGR